MTKYFHDPKEYVRGLQQILISDSKKIGFLFGAGTSFAHASKFPLSKIPIVNEMTKIIVGNLNKDRKNKGAIGIMNDEMINENISFNIETLLTKIELKIQVIGNGTLCGLIKKEFEDLRDSIKVEIINLVSVHKDKDTYIDNLPHCDFTKWINEANRKIPVEIFTTNYDYLLEMAFEYHGIPYFDGFIGAFEPFFEPNSVEDMDNNSSYSKLWKIHGSLGWQINDENKIVRKYVKDEDSILILPSILKYDNSKKQPYISFLDRLSNFLKTDDSVLITCGYSFNDQHINQVIFNALKKTNTNPSNVMCLLYDNIVETSEITKLVSKETRVSIYSERAAVIGGKFGIWKLNSEPTKDDSIQINSYFDEDGTPPGSNWTGEGSFKLRDFINLVEFLNYMNYENYKVKSK